MSLRVCTSQLQFGTWRNCVVPNWHQTTIC